MISWRKAFALSLFAFGIAIGASRAPAHANEPCLGKLYEIVAPPYPSVEIVRTVRVNPERPEDGRRITVRIPSPDTKEAFVWGSLVEIVERHPDYTKKLGYEVDRKSRTITYLDADGRNALIHRLRAAGDSDAPSIEFWNFNGNEEATRTAFADHWIQAQAPVTRYGRFHHHDTGVHSLGYLLLPAEIVTASRARFRALMELFRDPALRRFRTHFEDLIRIEIDRLDQTTADISLHFSQPLSKHTAFNLEMALSQVSRGTQGLIAAYSEFSHVTSAERAAMERIVAENAHPAISDGRLEQIAQALIRRHWKSPP